MDISLTQTKEEDFNRDKLKIWVDADATPRDVITIVSKAGSRCEVRVLFVSNHRITLPLNNPYVRSIPVGSGEDVADDYIVDHVDRGDLVITADIPLAARVVDQEVFVISPRGEEYNKENVGERLSIRDFMHDLRSTGIQTSGPKPYSSRDKKLFAETLDRLLTKALSS